MKRILFFLSFLPYLASAQVAKDTVTVLTTAEISAGAANDTANFYFIQDGSWKKIRMDSVFNYLRFRGMVDTIRNQTILGAKTFATAPTFNTALGGGSGGTGLTTFGAANRIPYSTSTTALTTDAGLTYDGTNFATTGTASATKFIPTGGTATGNGMYLPSSNTLGFSTNGGLRMQINSAGNIGLNIAPNANWESAARVMQINNATFGSSSLLGMIFGHNVYFDGTAYRILTTGLGNTIVQVGDGYYVRKGATGTSGNTVSMAYIFSIDPDNQVGIGMSNPSARFHLPAGESAAGSAPLKFTSGTNMSTPEAGAMEYDGTNLRFSIGANASDRRIVAVGLTGSITHDFADTNAQQSRDVTFTVTGATEGDVVSLGVPNGAVSANTCYTAWVSAANTVTIRFNNYSSGNVNPGNGTFKVFVTKY